MERQLEYDVVVVGGGVAGAAAAVGAARAGAKTLLIERNAYLGGTATHSNVSAYCGFFTKGDTPQKVVGGVGEMVLGELRSLGQETSYEISPSGNATIKFHPEYLKLALDLMLEREAPDVLFYSQVIEARTDGKRVSALVCVDDEGRFTVTAKNFIDATGNGNLLFLAGAQTTWGNVDGKVQLATLTVRVDGIPPDLDISPEVIRKAVVQAKEDGHRFLSKETGSLIRRSNWDYAYALLPSVELDGLDAQTLSDAERNTRRQAHSYVKVFQDYIPGMKNCRLTLTGPALGLREGRRMVGRYCLSGDDVLSARKRDDGIGRGAWNPEIHRNVNESGSYLAIKDNSYYDIPLDTLRSKDCENLYAAGRLACADDVAFASLRVMGTAFVTGQGAGVAAALAGVDAKPDIQEIRAELTRQGAIL